jgi:hypothetical protein
MTVNEYGAISTLISFPEFLTELSFGTICTTKTCLKCQNIQQNKSVETCEKKCILDTLFGSEKEFSSIGLDDVSTVFVALEIFTLDSNPSIEIPKLTAFLSKFATCKVISFFHMRNSITTQEEEILIHVLKCVTQ